MYYYKIYGQKVESDIDFAQLVVDTSEAEPSIRIMRRNAPEDILEQMKQRYTSAGERESWFYNKTLRCVIRDGQDIYYEPFDDINEQYLRTYILGYGLSMLFLQRGNLTIHGSCVRKDNQAIIISGMSGAGKSTLTSQFLSAGYEFMADDITLVECNEEYAVAYPGFPYQKLCRDVVEKKKLDTKELIYIDEDKDKFLVKWDGEYHTEGVELTTLVVILVGDENTKLEVKEAQGFEKLQYVVDNLFLKKRILFRENNPQLIKRCLDIASRINILVVTRPYGIDSASQQLELIEELLN